MDVEEDNEQPEQLGEVVRQEVAAQDLKGGDSAKPDDAGIREMLRRGGLGHSWLELGSGQADSGGRLGVKCVRQCSLCEDETASGR